MSGCQHLEVGDGGRGVFGDCLVTFRERFLGTEEPTDEPAVAAFVVHGHGNVGADVHKVLSAAPVASFAGAVIRVSGAGHAVGVGALKEASDVEGVGVVAGVSDDVGVLDTHCAGDDGGKVDERGDDCWSEGAGRAAVVSGIVGKGLVPEWAFTH